ncbi:MAG: hypothetical protein ACKOWF_11530 [Chloroflexota bacterium]
MRWKRRRLAGMLASACVASLLALPPGLAGANEAQRDRTAAETAEIRELPALGEIDDDVITSDELRAMLPGLLSEDYSPEQAEADQRGLIAIGLLPPGTDLMAMYEGVLGEQVAGFYDPETDRMYVISDTGEFGGMERMTYAHEVVHALQDAHLGLQETMDGMGGGNADRDTAVAALLEGDASAASSIYLERHPEIARDLLFAAAAPSGEMDSAPGAMGVSLIFPYLAGEKFVNALRAEGGWQAVDAAYADLPQSTEQIMHPEKYLAGEAPVEVTLPDPASLGEEWSLVVDDTMGELGVALLLADLGPGEGINAFTGGIDLPIPALNAAAGWGGDRYALWESGDREVLVWKTVWDSERDAAAFLRALAQHQQARFGGDLVAGPDGGLSLAADGAALLMRQDGLDVVLTQGPDPGTAQAALAAVAPEAAS